MKIGKIAAVLLSLCVSASAQIGGGIGGGGGGGATKTPVDDTGRTVTNIVDMGINREVSSPPAAGLGGRDFSDASWFLRFREDAAYVTSDLLEWATPIFQDKWYDSGQLFGSQSLYYGRFDLALWYDNGVNRWIISSTGAGSTAGTSWQSTVQGTFGITGPYEGILPAAGSIGGSLELSVTSDYDVRGGYITGDWISTNTPTRPDHIVNKRYADEIVAANTELSENIMAFTIPLNPEFSAGRAQSFFLEDSLAAFTRVVDLTAYVTPDYAPLLQNWQIQVQGPPLLVQAYPTFYSYPDLFYEIRDSAGISADPYVVNIFSPQGGIPQKWTDYELKVVEVDDSSYAWTNDSIRYFFSTMGVAGGEPFDADTYGDVDAEVYVVDSSPRILNGGFDATFNPRAEVEWGRYKNTGPGTQTLTNVLKRADEVIGEVIHYAVSPTFQSGDWMARTNHNILRASYLRYDQIGPEMNTDNTTEKWRPVDIVWQPTGKTGATPPNYEAINFGSPLFNGVYEWQGKNYGALGGNGKRDYWKHSTEAPPRYLIQDDASGYYLLQDSAGLQNGTNKAYTSACYLIVDSDPRFGQWIFGQGSCGQSQAGQFYIEGTAPSPLVKVFEITDCFQGDSAYYGDYSEDGTFNGKIKYVKMPDSSRTLYWSTSNNRWQIGPTTALFDYWDFTGNVGPYPEPNCSYNDVPGNFLTLTFEPGYPPP